MADNEQQEEQIYRLPIEWHYPEGFQSVYATNFVVQHTDHEFYLSFSDFPPPMVLGTDADKREQLEHLESVQASAVARIVVTRERMPELIELLQDNLRKYQNKQTGEAEE